MGVCQFCGMSTQKYCKVCLVYGCTAHMKAHYFDAKHRSKCASQNIRLDQNGVPIVM